MLELRIHGRGGQGVVTLAEMLASIALSVGSFAQTMPHFGVERRGAAVKTSVRLSDEPIKKRSQSFDPDTLVIMHENLLGAAFSDGEKRGAVLVVNSPGALPVAYDQWYVDATGIAVRNNLIIGGEPYTNVPMLGALCRALGLPAELMKKEIEKRWPKSAANIASAMDAYENTRFEQRGAA